MENKTAPWKTNRKEKIKGQMWSVHTTKTIYYQVNKNK